MDRRIIDYLPPFMRNYKEIKAIMSTEQNELESTWNSANEVLDNQFIQSATQKGIVRYETMLGITPKATYTLDERKFNILAKMNEQLPYSMTQLNTSLAALCGTEGYNLKLNADEYTLQVKLALGNENNIEAVKVLLNQMLPANIATVISMFNTHAMLADFTHEQLSGHTHKEIREDIL